MFNHLDGLIRLAEPRIDQSKRGRGFVLFHWSGAKFKSEPAFADGVLLTSEKGVDQSKVVVKLIHACGKARRRGENCLNLPPCRLDPSFHRGLRSEEHTSELQSRPHLVCRLL